MRSQGRTNAHHQRRWTVAFVGSGVASAALHIALLVLLYPPPEAVLEPVAVTHRVELTLVQELPVPSPNPEATRPPIASKERSLSLPVAPRKPAETTPAPLPLAAPPKAGSDHTKSAWEATVSGALFPTFSWFAMAIRT